MPTSVFEIQADLCRAMGNPLRLEIVHRLRGGGLYASEIAQQINSSPSVVSRHLAVLQQQGILAAQRINQGVLYFIANPKVSEICDLMRQMLAEAAAEQVRMIGSIEKE